MPRFQDIPQLTKSAYYRVNVGWDYLERWIAGMQEERTAKLDLDPDFQRAHVWTTLQQQRYVEYVLRGGKSGRELQFNCAGWMSDYKGPFVIVDGKQRLEAVRAFLRDELLAFGSPRKYFTDNMRLSGPDFVMCVNDLATRAEVLQWYLDLNTGGTIHTDDEIEKVRDMLLAEPAPTQKLYPTVKTTTKRNK